jgi:opacity protein-like surface antigen
MIKFSRLAVVAVVAATALATALSSSAFAQSYNPQVGMTNGQHRIPHRVHVRGRMPARRSGLHAFATTAPNALSPALNPYSPALNGGGSAGYNENLRTDTW